MIDLVQGLALSGVARAPLRQALAIPLVVAAGIAASRAIVRWGTGGSPGENVADVMYRATVKGGVIHSRPVVVKSLAAAILIGTGGSVGAEGPVVVLGAATASRIGRWLRASPNRLRTLVGCGAAAGISAAFNAPIAGVIFGAEKILGAAGGLALGPFVVASILAATVSRAAFGDNPVIALPLAYGVSSGWELLWYVILGLLTGLVAVAYNRGVWWVQDVFARVRRPAVAVALAAALVGGLDVVFRADLWGRGHETLDLGLIGARTAPFLLALAAAKLVATAATLGAGRVGGVFTPALFIGATFGGAAARALETAVPNGGLAPGASALVGMAGLVAGATHAPLTAIMMVFEMTRDYGLILPLMLTAVLAYGVARWLHPESIYTEWLVRRGVVLAHGADAAVLARLPVGESVNRRPTVVPAGATLHQIRAIAQSSGQTDFPVVDDQGRLLGMLSQAGVREAAGASVPATIVLAADLVDPQCDRATTEDSLLTALRRLGARDVNTLPVVAPDAPDLLVGIVTRQDLLTAYEAGLTAERH